MHWSRLFKLARTYFAYSFVVSAFVLMASVIMLVLNVACCLHLNMGRVLFDFVLIMRGFDVLPWQFL